MVKQTQQKSERALRIEEAREEELETRVFFSGGYGYLMKLGTSVFSDIAYKFQSAGKRLHAAKYHMISTHGLNPSDMEKLLLNEREFDYASKAALKFIEQRRFDSNYDQNECFFDITTWINDQIDYYKKHVYKK